MANLMISSTERRPFINREERVRAALAGKEVDLTEKYDFDYIKMMTKRCIKIHMESDSAIESAFP